VVAVVNPAAELLASGFYTGYAPKAPGTVGSVLGLLLGAALLAVGHAPLVFGILVVGGIGVWAVAATGQAGRDPGWIVIDEISGQLIALLALPGVSLFGLLLAFALFRLFDIWKPGPVGWADARHDEWGVMGDDWIAGLLAAACLGLLRLVMAL
jgi:phosphatidylglycerophosphatase A